VGEISWLTGKGDQRDVVLARGKTVGDHLGDLCNVFIKEAFLNNKELHDAPPAPRSIWCVFRHPETWFRELAPKLNLEIYGVVLNLVDLIPGYLPMQLSG